MRTKNYQPALDLSMYDGIQLRVKGNGLRYKFILRSDANWDTTAYTHSFDTKEGVWETISIPFTAFVRPQFPLMSRIPLVTSPSAFTPSSSPLSN